MVLRNSQMFVRFPVTYGPAGVTFTKSYLTFTTVNLSDFSTHYFPLNLTGSSKMKKKFLEGHYIIVASGTNGNPFREFLLKKPLSILRTK